MSSLFAQLFHLLKLFLEAFPDWSHKCVPSFGAFLISFVLRFRAFTAGHIIFAIRTGKILAVYAHAAFITGFLSPSTKVVKIVEFQADSGIPHFQPVVVQLHDFVVSKARSCLEFKQNYHSHFHSEPAGWLLIPLLPVLRKHLSEYPVLQVLAYFSRIHAQDQGSFSEPV